MAFIYFFLFFEKVWKSWKNWNYRLKSFVTMYSICYTRVNANASGGLFQIFGAFSECPNFNFVGFWISIKKNYKIKTVGLNNQNSKTLYHSMLKRSIHYGPLMMSQEKNPILLWGHVTWKTPLKFQCTAFDEAFLDKISPQGVFLHLEHNWWSKV